jgi:hypothetical protein
MHVIPFTSRYYCLLISVAFIFSTSDSTILGFMIYNTKGWHKYIELTNYTKFLEKFTAAQMVKKLSAFFGTRKFFSLTCSQDPPMISIPNQVVPILTLKHNFFKIHFNIILPSKLMFLFSYGHWRLNIFSDQTEYGMQLSKYMLAWTKHLGGSWTTTDYENGACLLRKSLSGLRSTWRLRTRPCEANRRVTERRASTFVRKRHLPIAQKPFKKQRTFSSLIGRVWRDNSFQMEYEGFWRWCVIICKIILLDFVHSPNYKIIN